MNNSVYGKTVENLWKRIHFRFANNANNYIRYTSKSSYVSHKILNKSVVTMHKTKPGLTIDKPIEFRTQYFRLKQTINLWISSEIH